MFGNIPSSIAMDIAGKDNFIISLVNLEAYCV